MSQVFAALILRTEGPGSPTRKDLDAAASLVQGQGLRVDRVGRRHLTVMGERDVLARALGVVPVTGRTPIALGEAPLAALFSAVEIAGKPEFFAKEPGP